MFALRKGYLVHYTDSIYHQPNTYNSARESASGLERNLAQAIFRLYLRTCLVIISDGMLDRKSYPASLSPFNFFFSPILTLRDLVARS